MRLIFYDPKVHIDIVEALDLRRTSNRALLLCPAKFAE